MFFAKFAFLVVDEFAEQPQSLVGMPGLATPVGDPVAGAQRLSVVGPVEARLRREQRAEFLDGTGGIARLPGPPGQRVPVGKRLGMVRAERGLAVFECLPEQDHGLPRVARQARPGALGAPDFKGERVGGANDLGDARRQEKELVTGVCRMPIHAQAERLVKEDAKGQAVVAAELGLDQGDEFPIHAKRIRVPARSASPERQLLPSLHRVSPGRAEMLRDPAEPGRPLIAIVPRARRRPADEDLDGAVVVPGVPTARSLPISHGSECS